MPFPNIGVFFRIGRKKTRLWHMLYGYQIIKIQRIASSI
jgi:hypothetical protein